MNGLMVMEGLYNGGKGVNSYLKAIDLFNGTIPVFNWAELHGSPAFDMGYRWCYYFRFVQRAKAINELCGRSIIQRYGLQGKMDGCSSPAIGGLKRNLIQVTRNSQHCSAIGSIILARERAEF